MLPFGQGFPPLGHGFPPQRPPNLYRHPVMLPQVPVSGVPGMPMMMNNHSHMRPHPMIHNPNMINPMNPYSAQPQQQQQQMHAPLPQITPIVPSPQQPPQVKPQPMMVAPGILNDIESPRETSGRSTESPSSQWSEHKTTDGRVYYYNREKKISSWTKPDELKTPEEREKCVWRVYKTAEGKPYYYNTETKMTQWNKPSALEEDVIAIEKTTTSEKSESKSSKKSHQSDGKSDLEKAMAATLKKLENNNDSSQKASTSGTSKKEENNVNNGDEKDSLKKRQVEKFKELIRDKYNDNKVSTNMPWEQAMKFLQHDPRFRILPKISEKKQVFNAWKTQRAKDERDEKRLAIKKAKEDLESWLLAHPKMRPNLPYRKADTLFGNEDVWKAVSDAERRDIFRDLCVVIEQRNLKNEKELSERNIKALADILDGIEEINYRTTWARAQRILIENADFASDSVLQGMDKEDALVVFQDHIKAQEQLYLKEKQLELKRIRRRERKVREAFVNFLKELNVKGILTSTSTWSALFPTISADQRFEEMLLQTGSTALDLFKFYVEDLKNRYYEDRRVIREILDSLKVEVTTQTTFDQLQQWVKADERGRSVDTGNMKLCYNSLYDKAQNKERESEREEQRKQKRQESAFRSLLRTLTPEVDPESKWETVCERIKNEEVYLMIGSDELRKQFFDDYIKSISEACGHHHSSRSSDKKKKSKKEKKKKHKRDRKDSDDETEPRSKKSKKSHGGHHNGHPLPTAMNSNDYADAVDDSDLHPVNVSPEKLVVTQTSPNWSNKKGKSEDHRASTPLPSPLPLSPASSEETGVLENVKANKKSVSSTVTASDKAVDKSSSNSKSKHTLNDDEMDELSDASASELERQRLQILRELGSAE